MKNKQKSKSSTKLDADLSAFSVDPALNLNDSFDQADALSDDDAKLSRKQLTGSKLMSQLYASVIGQVVPVVYKTVYESFKAANKIAVTSDNKDVPPEAEKPQSGDEKDITFEIDLLKILRYLLRRWRSLCAVAIVLCPDAEIYVHCRSVCHQ